MRINKECSLKHLGFLTTSFLSLTFVAAVSQAATIEFPEEELAKESVLPVFEGQTKAVKSRRVETEKKIEVGGGLSFIFNEPIFETMAFNIHGGYHLNNFHSIHTNFTLRQDDLSDDANEIENTPGVTFNFPVVPIPKWSLMLDYQITPYYGKISFTKNGVLNLDIFGIAGLGAIDVGGEVTLMANVGFGTNLYFTRRIALKADLKFLGYSAPQVINKTVTQPATGPLEPSAFESSFQISPALSVGLSFLL